VITTLLILISPWASALAAPEVPPAPVDAEARGEAEALRREMEQLRREVAELRERAADPNDLDQPPELPHRAAARTSFGGDVKVGPGEEAEEAVSFGGDVEVAGRVLGDAVSFGGNVVVRPSGLVAGDAVSFGGRVVVEDGGEVDGDRVAMGLPAVAPEPAREPPSDPGRSWSLAAADLGPVAQATDLMRGLYRKLVWAMWIAGSGVVVVGLFPRRVAQVAADLESHPVRAAVVGTLSSAFVLLFSLLFSLLTLGLGLPVSLLLVGALGIAWLFGFVGLCQAVGDRLPLRDRPHGRWVAFLVGVLLVTFVGSLPWVGWMVVGAASLVGVGSALSTRFGRA
jgi:hypothetical protein